MAVDSSSLAGQQSVFALLNLFLLLILWSAHASFATFWGTPSASLTAVLGCSVALRAAELFWLRKRMPPLAGSTILTSCSIAFNLALAVVLASIVDREDSQYSALLVVPILESAFRFGAAATLAVATAADGIALYWVWRYFHLHPPAEPGEYFEAGTLSIILLIVAVLGASMVRMLRRKQVQLERAHDRLLQQEKMAAVGRVSSAVAHEIRNPAAMILSSLATANAVEGAEREQMLEIARMESSRLVNLTNDLLAYARPRCPAPTRCKVRETLLYAADACRAHAAAKAIDFRIGASGEELAEYDESLLQQVLVNLILNAVDASPGGASVHLRIVAEDDRAVRIQVENSGGPIPAAVVEHLFEPFFTTKPNGTGLGLATACSVMLAQGGDLTLTDNSENVRFSVLLPAARQYASR